MPQEEREEPCPTNRAAIERGIVHPRSRTCRGCLFYSSYLRDSNQNPTCYGFSRTIPHSYRTLDERNATKDFKYACLGYGLHKEAVPSGEPPEGVGELPVCVGIEFLGDRRPVTQEEAAGQKEEALHESNHNLARHGAAPDEDFTSRLCRSAGRVAKHVANNVVRTAGALGDTVSSIFASDDGKKK